MTKQEAERFFKLQLQSWGLTDWKFEWGRGTRTIGNTEVRIGKFTRKVLSKKLKMSLPFFKVNRWQVIHDVFLHELAHAINFELNGLHGHGEEFKEIARQIAVPKEALGCAYKGKIVSPKKRSQTVNQWVAEQLTKNGLDDIDEIGKEGRVIF
jgi:hypothetical protein